MSVEVELRNTEKVGEPLKRARRCEDLLASVGGLKQDVLSARARAVYACWMAGFTFEEIARELEISKSLVQLMVREVTEGQHGPVPQDERKSRRRRVVA